MSCLYHAETDYSGVQAHLKSVETEMHIRKLTACCIAHSIVAFTDGECLTLVKVSTVAVST